MIIDLNTTFEAPKQVNNTDYRFPGLSNICLFKMTVGWRGVFGKLNDQDAVFGRQTDEHQDADLAVNIQRASGKVQPHQGACHRQRHREHDREGMHETFGRDLRDVVS